ncbi:MAG: hypothetical protein MHM6MM_006712, partial [Cercozoa sp. M6MM]
PTPPPPSQPTPPPPSQPTPPPPSQPTPPPPSQPSPPPPSQPSPPPPSPPPSPPSTRTPTPTVTPTMTSTPTATLTPTETEPPYGFEPPADEGHTDRKRRVRLLSILHEKQAANGLPCVQKSSEMPKYVLNDDGAVVFDEMKLSNEFIVRLTASYHNDVTTLVYEITRTGDSTMQFAAVSLPGSKKPANSCAPLNVPLRDCNNFASFSHCADNGASLFVGLRGIAETAAGSDVQRLTLKFAGRKQLQVGWMQVHGSQRDQAASDDQFRYVVPSADCTADNCAFLDQSLD